ncbi:TIM44-like domain-containing protein [Achromobacter mucicolens]|uniref:Tim44 domain-containing protein n=1 Tax=Achromobacter mucicolens TaxID=1389922 RepID=UPI002452F682|nr:TIM44-like domain-containing protein [Achromobacter mucicolens]WGJ91123.1 TIM44-like domain-containing protein [Achromobacter mucicolens]
MSKFSLSRFVAAALIAVSGAALVTASFDAEARRAGGGASVGRQSSNVTTQRQATTPPAATNNTAGATAAPAAAGAATAGAAGAAAKSGASRWLGPIAGIAAGLGIAALLSSMGLSGAFLEFLSSALLIAAVVFAVMFIIRRLRGAVPRTATQGAFGGANNASGQQQQPMWRESLKPGAAAPAAPVAAAPVEPPAVLPKAGDDNNWFVPGDFDTPNFLKQAKEQFVRIQAVWDSGSTDGLREFLTDDLITELKPQLAERGAAPNKTEVVLLNAEMLGIETVSDGHLASVRFSGMLREAPGTEAFRFEEVWNLFKPANGGWLLAGIQQIPVEHAS